MAGAPLSAGGVARAGRVERQAGYGPGHRDGPQPYERQPMWHRHGGGLVVSTDEEALRIEDQDWPTLTLDAFQTLCSPTGCRGKRTGPSLP